MFFFHHFDRDRAGGDGLGEASVAGTCTAAKLISTKRNYSELM